MQSSKPGTAKFEQLTCEFAMDRIAKQMKDDRDANFVEKNKDGVAQEGVSSTLLPENLRLASRLSGAAAADATTLAVFFDPQTSGGLLAGVPAGCLDACLADLRANGVEHAAAIGEIVARPALPDRDAILEGHLRMVPAANCSRMRA